MVDTRKKGARPLFVLWDYKAHGTENEDIPFHVKRMSAKYVALAEYFLDNPPTKCLSDPATSESRPMPSRLIGRTLKTGLRSR